MVFRDGFLPLGTHHRAGGFIIKMIGTILFQSFLAIVSFAIMIFFHEVGHSYFLRKYLKEDVSFQFSKKGITVGNQSQMDRLNNSQYLIVLSGGILIGFLPLILVMGNLSTHINFSLFLGYLWASKSDLKEITKKRKKS